MSKSLRTPVFVYLSPDPLSLGLKGLYQEPQEFNRNISTWVPIFLVYSYNILGVPSMGPPSEPSRALLSGYLGS